MRLPLLLLDELEDELVSSSRICSDCDTGGPPDVIFPDPDAEPDPDSEPDDSDSDSESLSEHNFLI